MVFERVFLPIVHNFKNKEAKTSEPRSIGARMSENIISFRQTQPFQTKKGNSLFSKKMSFLFCKRSYFFAYFLLNFSTLPSASTSFCFPVKKGWHFEHMSTCIDGVVDIVVKVSPHAQTAFASLYWG